MEVLATMNLESTLSTILMQLANFFGTTTEVVMQNLPIWLSKYGWFLCVQNIAFNLLFGAFIGAATIGLSLLIICGALEIEIHKKNIKWIILAFILITIIPCVISIVSCMIAPEFYALSNIVNAISK